MRHVILVICLFLAGCAKAATVPPAQVAPMESRLPTDTAGLLELLREGSNAQRMAAAEQLAKAGKTDPVVSMLAGRLKGDNSDRDTIEALGDLRSPFATPILIERLAKIPVPAGPDWDQLDMLDAILQAMTEIGDPRGIPVVKARFTASPNTQLAFALLAMGDSSGVPYLKRLLAHDAAKGTDASQVVAELNYLTGLDFLTRASPNVLAEFLPECIQGLRGDDFLRVPAHEALVKLTHYDFGMQQAAWQKWYDAHKDHHPIWGYALDHAARASAARFLEHLTAAGKTNPEINLMLFGEPEVSDVYAGTSSPNALYCVDSRAHDWFMMNVPDGAPPLPVGRASEYQVLFVVRFLDPAGTVAWPTSDFAARMKTGVLFRQEFPPLNLVVELTSGTRDAVTKATLVEFAKDAISPLREYAKSYKPL